MLGEGDSEADWKLVIRSFEEFRNAAGDQAAFDYHEFVVTKGLTVAQAAAAILEETEDETQLDRIEALRRYAATVTV
jgi:hypothetical protein